MTYQKVPAVQFDEYCKYESQLQIDYSVKLMGGKSTGITLNVITDLTGMSKDGYRCVLIPGRIEKIIHNLNWFIRYKFEMNNKPFYVLRDWRLYASQTQTRLEIKLNRADELTTEYWKKF
jgi:hypothetical protein